MEGYFIVWLLGLLGILLFNLANVLSISRQIARDKWVCWDSEKRVAQVKGLASPFLWGIFRPVIFVPAGLRQEEELEALAQRALRELYDLTGYQIESCVYDCTDLGTFYFAKTRKDLEVGNSFYERGFGEEEGYEH